MRDKQMEVASANAAKAASNEQKLRVKPLALLCALAGATTLGIATPGFAADWKTSANAKLSAESSDNIRLDFGEGADDAIETTESIALGLERNGRQFDVELSATAEFVQYTNSELLEDEENQFLNLLSSYKPSLNLVYGLDARYSRDTFSGNVRFLDQATGEPVAPGSETGLDGSFAREQTDVEQLRLSPSLEYTLSPRTDLSLRLDHTDDQYGQQQIRTLFDYDDTTVVAKASYKLSSARGDLVWLEAARGEYSSEFRNGLGDSIRYPVEIGYSRDFSERLTLAATVGATRTEFENLDITETEPTFTASALMRGKRSQYFLSLSQYVRPSAGGRPVKTQRAQFTSYYKLQEYSQLVVNVNYVDTAADANALGGAVESDYFNIEPSLRWTFSPQLVGELKYSYKERSNTAQNFQELSADSNTFSLSIKYDFTPG